MKRKYALCVGLNYPGTSAALSGCVNDAQDWRDALVARGYEVELMLEPTKRVLVDALIEMVAKARFGDRVVFTYSGHGTNLLDASGDEQDGRDEALVCADYRAGGLLVDDELDTLFSMARYGVRRLIFSDSCHSGTISRFTGDMGRVYAGMVDRPRYLPPSLVGEAAMVNTRVRARKGAPVVLVSGCKDDEYSYDAWFRGADGKMRANGAFSRAALDTLGRSATLKGWHAGIATLLPSTRFPQSPQLRAARHQRYWSL